MPETVGDDECYIVSSHDRESWENKLKNVLAESESFKSRYSILQELVNRFSLGEQVEELCGFFGNMPGFQKNNKLAAI